MAPRYYDDVRRSAVPDEATTSEVRTISSPGDTDPIAIDTSLVAGPGGQQLRDVAIDALARTGLQPCTELLAQIHLTRSNPQTPSQPVEVRVGRENCPQPVLHFPPRAEGSWFPRARGSRLGRHRPAVAPHPPVLRPPPSLPRRRPASPCAPAAALLAPPPSASRPPPRRPRAPAAAPAPVRAPAAASPPLRAPAAAPPPSASRPPPNAPRPPAHPASAAAPPRFAALRISVAAHRAPAAGPPRPSAPRPRPRPALPRPASAGRPRPAPELTPLKIRSHGASSVMHYDERYTPYIEMTGLLPFVQLEPEVEDGGKKDRVLAGATFTWIAANFAHCPEDADEEVIQRYARVYMWYVISRTIFADGIGKNAPWMWPKALTVLDNKFSWGSAALAYLYRQLDDACRRTTKDGGVGGCMLLLSVWSWERLPVGRPKSSKWNTWDDHGNPVRQPTWAYKWDLVSEVASEVNLLYKQYTNEMDSLTPEQVEWEPYGVGTNFGDAHTFELNPLCMQERHLWLMRCPLICNWAVEWHLPHRVLRQFGYFQPHPPEWVDTDTQLHRLDRRRQRKIKDWQKHHKSYVLMFEQSVQATSSIQ
ncbi:mutator protein [Hordeum vulgare]|nr:mutator protein [Hordeum vulgare]